MKILFFCEFAIYFYVKCVHLKFYVNAKGFWILLAMCEKAKYFYITEFYKEVEGTLLFVHMALMHSCSQIHSSDARRKDWLPAVCERGHNITSSTFFNRKHALFSSAFPRVFRFFLFLLFSSTQSYMEM